MLHTTITCCFVFFLWQEVAADENYNGDDKHNRDILGEGKFFQRSAEIIRAEFFFTKDDSNFLLVMYKKFGWVWLTSIFTIVLTLLVGYYSDCICLDNFSFQPIFLFWAKCCPLLNHKPYLLFSQLTPRKEGLKIGLRLT